MLGETLAVLCAFGTVGLYRICVLYWPNQQGPKRLEKLRKFLNCSDTLMAVNFSIGLFLKLSHRFF